ncbi:MAG: adenosine-specific kinase [Spirochaetes bacterium]|nr:adenosine-specific kinase [Spirochaetota bacterium]
MDIKIVEIKKPENINFILGQSHFIKTVEDIFNAITSSVPFAKFGIAFCEASGKRLIRYSGTSDDMIKLALENAKEIGCGHSFIIFIENFFPVNILNTLKQVPEICNIYCATANPTKIVILEEGEQRGIIGILDGYRPIGVEDENEKKWRQDLLLNFGYREKKY